MRIFLIKLSLFAGVMILLLLATERLNLYFMDRTPYRIDENVSKIVTGHSIGKYGIDPEYLDHSVNVCLESEPLFMSYYKIKELVNRSSMVDTFILPFGYTDVRKRYDSFLSQSDDEFIVEMNTRLCYLEEPVPIEDLRKYKVNLLLYWQEYLRCRIFPNFIFLLRNLHKDNVSEGYYRHMGSFSVVRLDPVNQKHLSDEKYIEQAVNARFGNDEPSEYYHCYLDSIVGFLADSGKRLVIINMPVHTQYKKQIPQKFIDHYYSIVNKVCESDNAEFIDMSDLIKDDRYFYDEIHLNFNGAQMLTAQIQYFMNKNWANDNFEL